MTLIVGLRTNDCLVVGAEQEESGGLTAKRTVAKLKLITGNDWAIVVGAAGDGQLAEKAMQRMKRDLEGCRDLTEEKVAKATEKILDSIYTQYVDKDPTNQGIALVIGLVCGDRLHLISTAKRVAQEQESMAYAGYGEDIGIYFMDRLHRQDANWEYTVNVAGFTLQQAVEACQYCGGQSEIYVLQSRPNPRWRSMGGGDIPMEFQNQFQKAEVSDLLRTFVDGKKVWPVGSDGYSDEFHPVTIDADGPFFPLEFFPSSWLRSAPYQKRVEEICTRSYNSMLQFGFVKMLLARDSALQEKGSEPALPQRKAKAKKEKSRNSGKKS